MDSNQPTANPAPVYSSPAKGIFGTGIPSSVAFVMGILLFIVSSSEIKCGGSKLMSKSGLRFVTGQSWQMVGGFGKEDIGKTATKANEKKEGNAQIFAIVAMALGVIGLGLSLTKSKKALQSAVIAGVLAGAALVMFMIDVKKWFKDGMAKQALDKARDGSENGGLDKFGDNIVLTLAFTPWFYIAIVAFLAAAFLCFKRAQSDKTLH
jgi:hypothetical protein